MLRAFVDIRVVCLYTPDACAGRKSLHMMSWLECRAPWPPGQLQQARPNLRTRLVRR